MEDYKHSAKTSSSHPEMASPTQNETPTPVVNASKELTHPGDIAFKAMQDEIIALKKNKQAPKQR